MNESANRNILWGIVILLLIVIAGIIFVAILVGNRPQVDEPSGGDAVATIVQQTISAGQPAVTKIVPATPPGGAPTPTQGPTPTPIPDDPANVLGKPSGQDNFDNANNWTLFDSNCFKSEITDGKYIMTSKGAQQFSCWEVTWPYIQNYYLETVIEMPETCQLEDRFGLFFRAPDNNRGYMYALSCDGRYAVTIWDGETTQTVIDLTASDAINAGAGQANRIGVIAEGDTFSLYANGRLLTQLGSSTYNQLGKIGYFVRAATDQGFTVHYDDLKVWLLAE